MNALMGDVIFSTEPDRGSFKHSFLEWRVKRASDTGRILVGLSLKPDGYIGPEGSVTNYINFDLDTATRLRDKLNECIAFAEKEAQTGQ